MSTKLQFPKAIEEALCGPNPPLSRRSFLRSSGALVLTLTLDGVPGGRALAQAAGAQHYLTKPLDVRELLALVDELLAPAPLPDRAE